jgi:predicted nucleotidyltransferase
MQELLAKTNSELKIILDELVCRIHPIFGEKLKKVILFGSYARGDYDAESDVDLMLMLDEEDAALKEHYKKIVDIIVDLDLKYDVVLSTILQSEAKFNKFQNAMPFYSNVRNEGVVVYEQ